MARFKFRLQGYLNVKEKIEEQKKLEYGKAIQKLEEEKEKKRAIEAEAASRLDELRIEMGENISPERFINYKQYLTLLEKNAIKQEGEIKRAGNFAESKRIELVGAMKQRKMVDVLKEHDYEDFLEEEKKAEQRIVDEIVSYRYGQAEE